MTFREIRELVASEEMKLKEAAKEAPKTFDITFRDSFRKAFIYYLYLLPFLPPLTRECFLNPNDSFVSANRVIGGAKGSVVQVRLANDV